MSKKVYQDKFYIKPGKKQIVYGHEGHYYDVTNDVIKAMFHYMLLNFVELNFNKNEKKVINGMIANSFKRIKQEKMRGRTHKQRDATYNFFVFRLLSLIEALLTKRE